MEDTKNKKVEPEKEATAVKDKPVEISKEEYEAIVARIEEI